MRNSIQQAVCQFLLPIPTSFAWPPDVQHVQSSSISSSSFNVLSTHPNSPLASISSPINSPIFTRLCQIFICFFFNFWPDATHTHMPRVRRTPLCPPDWPTWLAPSPSSSARWRWPNRNPLKKLLAIGDPKISFWNHQFTWSHFPKNKKMQVYASAFFSGDRWWSVSVRDATAPASVFHGLFRAWLSSFQEWSTTEADTRINTWSNLNSYLTSLVSLILVRLGLSDVNVFSA